MARSVLIYSSHPGEPEHERACHIDMARRLALMLGRRFDGYFSETAAPAGDDDIYWMAADTLIGTQGSDALGIQNENQFFGGVVPHSFVSTKAITHPLLHTEAASPEGWSPDFARHTKHVVLPGYTVFDARDALPAARALLRTGAVRVKPVFGRAGRGQTTIMTEEEFERLLAGMDSEELNTHGLVLEQELTGARTYSVGQVRVGGIVASYVGRQYLTRDNSGEQVYGGSELIVTRGDYAAIFALDLSTEMLLVVAQAQLYDRAATLSFPGFFASRRNYDVACGYNAQGRMRCGVLEQSWRPGGASAAEILALEVFHSRPDVRTVKTSTLELFGADGNPPRHAIELFNGEDRELGHLRKYVMLERYGYQ